MQTWSSIWDHERQFKLPNSTCWIMKIKRHVPEFQTLKTWKLEPIVFFNYIRIPLTQNIWSLTVGFKLRNSTWFICWGCFPCPKKITQNTGVLLVSSSSLYAIEFTKFQNFQNNFFHIIHLHALLCFGLFYCVTPCYLVCTLLHGIIDSVLEEILFCVQLRFKNWHKNVDRLS